MYRDMGITYWLEKTKRGFARHELFQAIGAGAESNNAYANVRDQFRCADLARAGYTTKRRKGSMRAM